MRCSKATKKRYYDFVSRVYVLNPGGGAPQTLQRILCNNEEKELQAVLEKNLDLLPGEQINPDAPRRWLMVKREVPVPDPDSGSDSFSLDFLLADQDAVPTFVECKRFNDTRARRAVVGQMLDYAANGQYYWTKDELRTMAYETAKKLNTSLDDALKDLELAEEFSSIDSFFERFYANLQQGQVRIIFFLEDSSLQLRSIADFLNKQMEQAEVLVVEARQYRHNDSRIIVPNLIGYTDQIRLSKKTVAVNRASSRPPMTREALLASMIQRNHPSEVAKVAQDIVSNLEHLGLATRSFPSCINTGVQIS